MSLKKKYSKNIIFKILLNQTDEWDRNAQGEMLCQDGLIMRH